MLKSFWTPQEFVGNALVQVSVGIRGRVSVGPTVGIGVRVSVGIVGLLPRQLSKRGERRISQNAATPKRRR